MDFLSTRSKTLDTIGLVLCGMAIGLPLHVYLGWVVGFALFSPELAIPIQILSVPLLLACYLLLVEGVVWLCKRLDLGLLASFLEAVSLGPTLWLAAGMILAFTPRIGGVTLWAVVLVAFFGSPIFIRDVLRWKKI